MRRFPVMVGVGGGFSVPWSLVEPFERQAQANHGQSLERLAERGGLSPFELWAVMHSCPRDVARAQLSDETAHRWALSLVSLEDERDALRAQLERVRTMLARWETVSPRADRQCALGVSDVRLDVLDALEGK